VTVYTWRDIPGWFDFQDIYEQAVREAPASGAHFVEVGVLFGKSAAFMANQIRESGKEINFCAVDPFAWTGAGVERETERASGDLKYHDLLEKLKALPPSLGARAFASLLATDSWAEVDLVPCDGVSFAMCFAPEQFDFVFIDAAHTYEDTVGLLRAFLPKVKIGGVLAGHDHVPATPGVAQAVDEVLGNVEQRGSSFWWRKP
jgi:predicted O-methyltransferase YrrM